MSFHYIMKYESAFITYCHSFNQKTKSELEIDGVFCRPKE